MLHKFIPSSKKDVFYCSYCGCLSYKNVPSKNILKKHNNYIIKIDPLSIKYNPVSLHLDLSLLSHQIYIIFREKGLEKIYFLSNLFNIEKMIMHKAIGLMDQIFLNRNNIPIDKIEIIASICLLLSFEFNYCCIYSNKIDQKYYKNSFNNINKNNIKGLNQYIIKEINDIIYWQTFCLKNLDYNLGKYTAFDYLNLFFELGVVFIGENINISNKYDFCFNILEIFINNYSICKYNQYVVALSIIYIQFHNNYIFNEKLFKYIYGVDFSKSKYKNCIEEINKFINNIFHSTIYDLSLINHKYINNNLAYNYNHLENINYNDMVIYDKYINNNLNNFNSSLTKELFIQYIYLYYYILFVNSNKILKSYNGNFSSFIFSNNKINQILENIFKIKLYDFNINKNNINSGNFEN